MIKKNKPTSIFIKVKKKLGKVAKEMRANFLKGYTNYKGEIPMKGGGK